MFVFDKVLLLLLFMFLICVCVFTCLLLVFVSCVGRRGVDDSDANVSEGSPYILPLRAHNGGGQSAPGYSRLSLSRLSLSVIFNSGKFGKHTTVCVYKSHCRRPHVCFGDLHFSLFPPLFLHIFQRG